MNMLILGVLIGALAGLAVGSAYDWWKVERIVDTTILKYRVDEQERKAERLQRFIDEKGGAE